MILTKEQIEQFTEAAKPMIKFLNDNCHPHVKVIIDINSAEILEGSASIKCDEFIKD